MANPVVNTTMCTCSFGAAPAVLPVTSQQTVLACGQLQATIMDNRPPTFGMCSCPATAAAMGVLTPMPCVPAVAAPWAAGVPTVLVGGKPLLNHTSKLICSYGGGIQVTMTPALTINSP